MIEVKDAGYDEKKKDEIPVWFIPHPVLKGRFPAAFSEFVSRHGPSAERP